MDLIALAVPFFLLALLGELAVDRYRGTGYYRLNDAINSLSAGTLSTTTGYFTKLLPLLAWGYVLENFALLDLPLAWFDASPRGIALWIAAAVGWDFCYYWFHRLSHEYSILWAAHVVHHQSEDYNLSTALRQTSTGFLFGWIFYLPLFLVGFPLEVLITVNAINLIYQFWVHTRHIDRLGVLDYILVTPSNHRVHHARNDRYIDRNYGGMFILWDRLFGTFEDESDEEDVVFGVRKPLASWDPVWANLQVYESLWFDARHARRWRDKLRVWVSRTGWRPEDVRKAHPERSEASGPAARFDPAIPPGFRRYLVAQFLVAVLLTLWIARIFSVSGPAAVLLPSIQLWLLLWSLGRINEGREDALRVEMLRLLVAVPGIAWLMVLGGLPRSALLVAMAYSLVSLLPLLTLSKSEKALKTINNND
ncbi:MAG: sterol desaturase family protein [Woeseiaceae bacterium]|jgi:sterol desaturase/sphingolipid hydroxylase (fatty acid hydroxylase superfamily)|nr:sterol desaturase family protein [Woeseiaceae bacterium]